MAKILGHTTHSRHPSEFTLAPIDAIKTLLDRLNWQASDVDLFEINEAFAMVTMLAIKEVGIDSRQSERMAVPALKGIP